MLCQQDAKASCRTKDEGRPFGTVLAGETSNSHKLLRTKTAVVNVMEKAGHRSCHGRMRETSANELLMTSKPELHSRSGRAWQVPTYGPCGVRRKGSVTFIRAFVRNLKTGSVMIREKARARTASLRVGPRREADVATASSLSAGWQVHKGRRHC